MITIEHIEAFTESIKKGMLVNVEVGIISDNYNELKKKKVLKAIVEEIYPHVTKTSRGTYMNKDLFFWNGGKAR